MPGCKSKEEGKDQESIQSCVTPDPGRHMGKLYTHFFRIKITDNSYGLLFNHTSGRSGLRLNDGQDVKL